jgi:hypothetical protein
VKRPTLNQRVTPGHRVLLVREWDQQVGGSGCCGRLNSSVVDALCETTASPYEHARRDMQATGRVYTALRERFPDDEVEITVVDPRNTMWLLPAVWRDASRRGLPVLQRLRQVARATAPCTLVCDGLVLASDATPGAAVSAVEEDIRRRS